VSGGGGGGRWRAGESWRRGRGGGQRGMDGGNWRRREGARACRVHPGECTHRRRAGGCCRRRGFACWVPCRPARRPPCTRAVGTHGGGPVRARAMSSATATTRREQCPRPWPMASCFCLRGEPAGGWLCLAVAVLYEVNTPVSV
jgi:hypothetical protein